MTNRPDVVRVIRAIADGNSVDWDAVDASALDASMRDILSELHVVSRIAAVHNPSRESAAPSAADESAEPIPQTWGPLTIMEPVGRGTFGDVYRAWDGRLDREVALKLLRHDTPASEGHVTTVVEEGRLLARVRHPNVVTVYGADRVNGGVGIWMEFIEGKTLEALLTEVGPFQPHELAEIGVEVCKALTAVHRAGLLHGDVKARNVMREEGGRIVLMDFGAGRDVSHEAGRLAGTALYLAPEVLDGAAATAQSEIYSLGVMLYHLASDSYPVRGRTLQEIRSGHRDRVSTLRNERDDLPESLILAIERALSSDPGHRFESTELMQAALATVLQGQGAAESGAAHGDPAPDSAVQSVRTASRRRTRGLAVGGVVLVLASGAIAASPALRHRIARVGDVPGPLIESIAILPFDGPGDDDRFLADGIADEIARRLGQMRHVRVLTRESSGRIQETDVRERARRLGVQAVLSGSLRRSLTGFDVHVRLMDGVSGREVTSADYAGQFRDIGGARGPAPELVIALQRRLWPGNEIAAVPERSEAAYLSYLRGRSQLSQRTEESLRAAITRFEQAVAADPGFAEAYAGLADAHTLTGIYGIVRHREAGAKAKAAAMEAIRLDDRLAEAHTSLAFVMELWEHRWSDAEASFKRAIALNPSYAPAHHWYALSLDSLARPDEAIHEIQTALALEPLSAAFNTDFAMILAHQRRYDAAIEQFQKALALHPTYADAHKELAWAYTWSGHFDAAMASFQRAGELGIQPGPILEGIGVAHARAGHRALALAAVRELESTYSSNPEAGAGLAAGVLAALGDRDGALDLLLRAFPEGHANILIEEIFDPIRGEDPRYQELLRRTGLSTPHGQDQAVGRETHATSARVP
jgi:serine/threonine-protein kinase